MAFPTRKQMVDMIRRKAPYGKVCAAFLDEGTIEAACKAGGGITKVEAVRQLRSDLGILVDWAADQNV